MPHDRLFGCHLSAAGGYEKALQSAKELEISCMQIHPSPPQRWNSKPFAPGVENKFLELRAESGIQSFFFHGIYLINLATPDAQKHHLGKLSLVHDLQLISRMRGDGVIFHVGSMKDQETEEQGIEQVVKGLNWVLENSPSDARLIMEVAAGSGKIVGDRLEELSAIYGQVDAALQPRLGFGLDTQHMWASGYNWQTELEAILDQIELHFGWDKVWAIHLNDSKTACGSRTDRHENLGEGLIGKETIQKIVRHPKLATIPLIMETPGLKTPEGTISEVNKLKQFLA
ncbi:MAG: deoxyribonuclease IV [Oligoflexia bacterium]|nr:deoxyribonuclease IV [Oligoflexia bacterium]